METTGFRFSYVMGNVVVVLNRLALGHDLLLNANICTYVMFTIKIVS